LHLPYSWQIYPIIPAVLSFQKGAPMNRNLLKLAPMALVLVLAAGCASTSQVDEAKAMAASAQKAADEAKQAAADAQNTANQALQTANEAKQASDAANSRIDRAFKKSMHK
jgi:murein lipoprotein